VLSPVLRAKHCWYRDEGREALAHLEAVAGAFDVSDSDLDAAIGLAFEGFLAELLANAADDDAIARLWDAFPGRYAIEALEARGELDAAWLRAAAADGLLSTDPADFGLVAKVVLAPVPDVIEPERLSADIAAAEASGAWERYIRAQPERTSSLLLDAVFHRARVMRPVMVLDRLDVIAGAQPGVIDVVADTLAGSDPEEVARVGMRVDSGSPDCAARLVQALRSRDFDALPAACLPEPFVPEP